MTYKEKQDVFRFVYSLVCTSKDSERMEVLSKILIPSYKPLELPELIGKLSEYIHSYKKF